jgi:FemAB-related protein (PEP-CTERM system-associated)
VRVETNPPDDAWESYVRAHPDASLFHHLAWQRSLERTFRSYRPCHRIAWRGDSVVGVLPLYRVPGLPFGCSLISTPLGVYGGVCADDEEAGQALIDDAAAYGRTIGAQYVELRHERAVASLPTKDLYFTFRREIHQDHEVDLKALPAEKRRAIRVAEGRGLTCRIGGIELLDAFYDVYTRNMRTLGSPAFPHRLFVTLLEEYGTHARIFGVFQGDTLTSASFNFFYRDVVMPYYAASTPAGMAVHTNVYMYWCIMCHAAEHGFKVIDFGRSKKDSGPYHFKRRWGITPTHVPYQYQLLALREIPNLSPTNPKFALPIRIWQRMPLPITRWLGPKLSRYFP